MRLCGVNAGQEDGGRKDGEDSIISARLVQFVTPAVVFNQPPRAACTANSLIISLFLVLCPCGQLQQMGALSRDPQLPPRLTKLWASRYACTLGCTYCIHDAQIPGEQACVFSLQKLPPSPGANTLEGGGDSGGATCSFYLLNSFEAELAAAPHACNHVLVYFASPVLD